MKAYTDLEQSKKLAEILPLESADMYWLNRHIDLTETKYEVFVIDKSNKYIDFFKSYAVAIENKEIMPCWSLTALLNYIKDKCGYFELVYLNSTIDGRANILKNVYRLSTDIYRDVYEKEAIDACYDMIIKLYKQKLL